MILNKIEKEFIETHADLIEKEDWRGLYAQRRAFHSIIRLYDILKGAGIDLLKDYHTCPNGYAARCESLPSDLDIPEGVDSIGNVAFFQTTIERVHLPTTIKNIGDGAFSHCEDLIEINIPAAIETIGMNSFRNCNSLKEVKFAKTSSLFCI